MIPKSSITSSPQEARVTTATLTKNVKNRSMYKALAINFDDADDVGSNNTASGGRKQRKSTIFSSSSRMFGGGSGSGAGGAARKSKTKKGKSIAAAAAAGGGGDSPKVSKLQQRRNKKNLLKHLGAQVACPLSGAFLHNDGNDSFEKLDNLMAVPPPPPYYDYNDVCGSDIVVDRCDTDHISDDDDDYEEEEAASVFCSENSNLTASTTTTTSTTSTRSMEEDTASSILSNDDDDLAALSFVESEGGNQILREDKKSLVRFYDAVVTWKIPSISTYTKEEWEDCWYSEVEREVLNHKREQVISRMEAGKSELPYRPYRGLENWTREGSDMFKFITKRMIDAVLDEQENQWKKDVDDHDQIAVISQTVSVLSVIKAIRSAQQDEIDANEIYLVPSTENHVAGAAGSTVIIDSGEDDEVETVCSGMSSVRHDSKKKTKKISSGSSISSTSARLLLKKKRSSGDKAISKTPSFHALVERMNRIESDIDDIVGHEEV